eukprot:SAG31_NODE_210_length_20286_cov_22.684748_24_plen_198_part_00
MDAPVEATRQLLDAARSKGVPIYFTTLNYRPDEIETGGMLDFKPFEGKLEQGDAPPQPAAQKFWPFDERACEIDSRLAARPSEIIIPKESSSAFHGTPLLQYLIGHGVDTVLVTGCQTSACSRATAMDARSYNFKTHLVKECNGDRSAVAHEFSLHDIASRFADVTTLAETLRYVHGLEPCARGAARLIDTQGNKRN